MVFANETAVVRKIPGQRIATTIETTDSTTFRGTETVVMRVTAPLVSSRVYKVVFDGCLESTTANTRYIVRIREDNLAGAVVQQRNVWPQFTGSIGVAIQFSVEHQAGATGNKTFVLTAVRATGSDPTEGNLSADSLTPVYFYVEYIRGG